MKHKGWCVFMKEVKDIFLNKRKLYIGSVLFVLFMSIGCLFLANYYVAGATTATNNDNSSSDDGDSDNSSKTHLMTVYDRGEKTVFLTAATTLKEALQSKDIVIGDNDTVEPSLDEVLVATDYQVNIYRARLVTVVDGAVRTKVMTSYQVASRIAESANIQLEAEDTTTLTLADDITSGAGLELTIDRATSIELDLYGTKSTVRTQGETVQELLDDKNITLGDNDFTSPSLSTQLTEGMQVRVWREGKQTITVDEPTDYGVEIIYDADRPLGYRAVQSAGVAGVQSVTYEIEIKDGVEVSRQEIARITTQYPVKQVEVIGLKNNGTGLTKAKGAQQYTDSQGVVHRETYYDLNMSTVMQACGQGGHYIVRSDGIKVDAQGYVIIASNYTRYPRCSIVETSVGLGKVYDTGGFVSRYPDGFDIATDWSTADGI